MNETKNQKTNKVEFDPGFGPYVLVFSTTYFCIQDEVKKFKNITQRKMKYKSYENGLFKICDNLIAFYLGCMLYGAYLKNKYNDSPCEISGNELFEQDIELCKNSDMAVEVFTLEKFIKNNDKNPFATRKLNAKYNFIIDNYIEFLELNNYFTTVKMTNDIQLPTGFTYINDFNTDDLAKLMDTLNDAIKAKKLEKLLESDYFVNIK